MEQGEGRQRSIFLSKLVEHAADLGARQALSADFSGEVCADETELGDFGDQEVGEA